MPGSSPLTRGKRSYGEAGSTWDGLIPAHAGKTASHTPSRARTLAHPRSRGENETPAALNGEREGSSPLTRGKPRRLAQMLGCPRLIPAHAGKTTGRGLRAQQGRAHPRSRGENIARQATLGAIKGSSPLTRGKPADRAAGRGR